MRAPAHPPLADRGHKQSVPWSCRAVPAPEAVATAPGTSSTCTVHGPPRPGPCPVGQCPLPGEASSLPQERLPLTLCSPERSTAVPAGVSPSPSPDLPARPWGPDHSRTTDPRPHRAAGLQGERRSDCGESGHPLPAEAGIPWVGQQEWPRALLHGHSPEGTSPVSMVFSRNKLQPRVLHFSKTWARGFLSDTE